MTRSPEQRIDCIEENMVALQEGLLTLSEITQTNAQLIQQTTQLVQQLMQNANADRSIMQEILQYLRNQHPGNGRRYT